LSSVKNLHRRANFAILFVKGGSILPLEKSRAVQAFEDLTDEPA